MNKKNNVFQKKEVENQLKNFQEGRDYSVTPTGEPDVKIYTFHNEQLRSKLGCDKIPVWVRKETYNGQDYTYRGHFEQGKDYQYTWQQWNYGENYQGNRGTDILNHGTNIFGGEQFKNWMDEVKWDEHHREYKNENDWKAGWTYRGKPGKNKSVFGFGLPDLNDGETRTESIEIGRVNPIETTGYASPNKVVGHIHNSDKENWKKCCPDACHRSPNCKGMIDPHDSYFVCQDCDVYFCSPECKEMQEARKCKNKIEYVPGNLAKNSNSSTEKDDNHSNLQKENHQLREQLFAVQKQLTEFLERLAKLESQEAKKLTEELVETKKVNQIFLANGGEREIKEQVQKSHDLLQKVSASVGNTTNNDINKKNNGSSIFPCLAGGSLLLGSILVLGYYWLKKNKKR